MLILFCVLGFCWWWVRSFLRRLDEYHYHQYLLEKEREDAAAEYREAEEAKAQVKERKRLERLKRGKPRRTVYAEKEYMFEDSCIDWN